MQDKGLAEFPPTDHPSPPEGQRGRQDKELDRSSPVDHLILPEELQNLAQRSIFSEELRRGILDFFRDRRTIVVDLDLTLVDSHSRPYPRATNALRALNAQGTSLVIWTTATKEYVNRVMPNLEEASNLRLPRQTLVIARENFMEGVRQNKGDLLATVASARAEGYISADEYEELLLATDTLADWVNSGHVKPHFLFFPPNTPSIDDSAKILERSLAGSPVRDELIDQFPPHGRTGGLLPRTGVSLITRYPILRVSEWEEGMNLSPNFLRKAGLLK